jgi:hypothetical protein
MLHRYPACLQAKVEVGEGCEDETRGRMPVIERYAEVAR